MRIAVVDKGISAKSVISAAPAPAPAPPHQHQQQASSSRSSGFYTVLHNGQRKSRAFMDSSHNNIVAMVYIVKLVGRG
jgi:hypothetical protein